MTKPEMIDTLAEKIAHRFDGCPILLAVEVMSAAIALGFTREEIDLAFSKAEQMYDARKQ